MFAHPSCRLCIEENEQYNVIHLHLSCFSKIHCGHLGICLEKCHFGFSKYSKFKRVAGPPTFSFNDILRLCTIVVNIAI